MTLKAIEVRSWSYLMRMMCFVAVSSTRSVVAKHAADWNDNSITNVVFVTEI